MSNDQTISGLDLVIIVAYLLGILTLGVWVSHKRRATPTEYFLAGRTLPWYMVGAALFATNISTIHLVGLAADGYGVGMVIGNFEWMAVFCIIILGLVFAPLYFRSKISTLPEYLERRYSPGSRTALAFIAVVAALLIHIGISLYAGAEVLRGFFGIEPIYSMVIIAGITTVYTVLGGLKAVVVTEAIQAVILLGGAVLVTVLAIFALPDHGIHSYQEFKDALRPDQLSMIHELRNDEGGLNDFSWFSMMFGFPILGIWYWCADQTIVQRVLGARSQRDAQLGPLFAASLKILPPFLMVLPGVIAYVLFADVIGDDNNQALPTLVLQLVPTGLKGLITAGLLAALMSTIASALNSCGTLVAIDIVKRAKPDISDAHQVLAGRVAACVVMVLAMLWSTQGAKFGSIFQAINNIPMAFAPSITCVFIWGVLWSRGTKQASLVTLVGGFIVGIVLLAVDLPLVGETKLVSDGWGIPFMQQGAWLFLANSIVYVTVSFMTPKPAPEDIEDVCWQNPLNVFVREKVSGLTDPRVLGGLLFCVMLTLYWIMR